jgi:AraC-like DNA-binding protein
LKLDPRPDRLGAWREAQSRVFIPFDVQAAGESKEPFDVRIARRRIGPISIIDFECGRAHGQRGKRQIAATEEDTVGILLMRRGRLGLTLDGRSLLVGPGDAVIWDSVREGSWVSLTPIAKRTLVLPRDVMRSAFPRLERVLSQPLSARTGAMQLLNGYVDNLVRVGAGLTGTAASAAVDGAVALARGALAGELPPMPDLRTALVLEVPRYIDAHLADPGLSPASIARAHAVSVRTLYEAFEGTGETPSALIRRRRLERCHEELSQEGGESITEIASRWGFRDSSTFSRAFREQFGVAPREVRATARPSA